ncbi:PhzF family phenazine biosynthesis protein [Burkholderia oklahomensis]|uniref:PhzF family phenazine biosynthesis protein n=1 Tax=Burkholderia oklahomensis TaxID=342113 RepID=UPI00264F8B30|nr:PhzF family phenazine biosynthesis protein [Burkholderia oklahomensis]MDN7675023.1 PhzF family phenazine biosynthesis protein [Burkholderia oklahomensis]
MNAVNTGNANAGRAADPTTSAPIYQVDAFANRRFAGNPAAVALLEHFPDDATMQAIAAENNLAETAFVVPHASDYRLRWFTPRVGVPLCGHATLASAAVVMERIVFDTASGPLTVDHTPSGYRMDFPARPTMPSDARAQLAGALGAAALEDVQANAFVYLVRLASVQAVRVLNPDMAALAALDRSGMIVTAADGGDYDFVSRYFAPAKGVPEEPVTGSAHCALAPYRAARLGKTAFRAHQASPRGGELRCRLIGERVELEGSCVFYLEGRVTF